MIFNLTNIETFDSRNGYGMTAKFWINNVFAADFSDDGDGSQPNIYLSKTNVEGIALFEEFMNELKALPEIYLEAYETHVQIDQYLFIDLLHAAIVNKTEFKLLA